MALSTFSNLDSMADVRTDLNAAITEANNFITLHGVAQASTDLGTFTGSTITDTVTIKVALQELETEVETKGTGSGDALVANDLSQFAATTSAQLAGVISDETGTGLLVFATSPALTTPDLGTPSAIDLTNATNVPTTGLPAELGIAVSDETTELETGTAKATFRMPFAMTLTAVKCSVTTAPTDAVLTVDINEGGTTILSTKLTIDSTEKTSTTAATAAVISDSTLADDAEMTIDIDTVGSTIAGAGLKIWLIGTRT